MVKLIMSGRRVKDGESSAVEHLHLVLMKETEQRLRPWPAVGNVIIQTRKNIVNDGEPYEDRSAVSPHANREGAIQLSHSNLPSPDLPTRASYHEEFSVSTRPYSWTPAAGASASHQCPSRRYGTPQDLSGSCRIKSQEKSSWRLPLVNHVLKVRSACQPSLSQQAFGKTRCVERLSLSQDIRYLFCGP